LDVGFIDGKGGNREKADLSEGMSAKPPITEVAGRQWDFRKVPGSDIGRGALVQVDPGIVVRKRLAAISLLHVAARQSVDI
jgi:hypothetical protein